jgi:FG-GAP-like repeat
VPGDDRRGARQQAGLIELVVESPAMRLLRLIRGRVVVAVRRAMVVPATVAVLAVRAVAATPAVPATLAVCVALAVAAPAAFAAPAPVGGLVSTTHPDPASWYASNAPGFSWTPALGVAGYAYLIDRTPGTTPSATITASAARFSTSSATAGREPWDVAAGDLNGDGTPDLVVADYAADTVSVLLGNGDGSFQGPVDYPAGVEPHGLALGDLNGDGKPDVVVTDWGGKTVDELLNTGGGTLAPAVAFTVGVEPSVPVIGDFNGDGKPDVAVTIYGASTVGVLLGNGDGTFQPLTSYATGANAEAVTAGDFNGDGRPDLAVANWGGNSVSVLLGNGDGTFQTRVDYSVGAPSAAFPASPAHPHAIVVADLNGDGYADLAVANWGGNSVSVLLGKGDGTFALGGRYNPGWTAADLAVADFNGDGVPDLAVVSRGNDTVSVLLGKGDGSFMALRSFAMSADPHALVVDDFNGDGAPDLAVACNATGSATVGLLGGIPSNLPFTAAYGGLADGTWYFHVSAIDEAGVAGQPSQVAVHIDTTPPTTTQASAAPAPDAAGWNSGDVVVTLHASDAGGSGVRTTQYAVHGSGAWTDAGTDDRFTVPGPADHGDDGVHTYDYRAVDDAGNDSTLGAVTVAIDTTPPLTQAATADGRPLDATTWHAGPLAVTLAASDPTAADGSSSGVSGGQAMTQYSTDGGATWQAGTSLVFPRWKRGGGSGAWTVLCRSTDEAGNTADPVSVPVLVDNSAPVAADDAPADVQSGPVTVDLTAHDSYSGVAFVRYSLDGGVWTQVAYPGLDGVPVTVTGDGGHTLRYCAVDNAGNIESGYRTCTVTIDSAGAPTYVALGHRSGPRHPIARRQ